MIFDLFSARSNPRPKPSLYVYDSLPQPFRVQVCYILDQAIGKYYAEPGDYSPASPSYRLWISVRDILRTERGVFCLVQDSRLSPKIECLNFFLQADAPGALDFIEVCFRVIDRFVRDNREYNYKQAEIELSPDSAIQELNRRFDQHHLGYQFVGGELIKRDSQYVHAEVVEPAIHVLMAAGFDGPNDEFLRAHKAYLKGSYKEAIREALTALESTLKTILLRRKWPFDRNKDAANKLFAIAFENGLVPGYLQSEFSALRTTLEAGVPTLRNRTAGHGQGPDPVDVPQYLAAYALHMSAAAIIFLVAADQNLK
jgi:hypothetical protein